MLSIALSVSAKASLQAQVNGRKGEGLSQVEPQSPSNPTCLQSSENPTSQFQTAKIWRNVCFNLMFPVLCRATWNTLEELKGKSPIGCKLPSGQSLQTEASLSSLDELLWKDLLPMWVSKLADLQIASFKRSTSESCAEIPHPKHSETFCGHWFFSCANTPAVSFQSLTCWKRSTSPTQLWG